MQSFVYTLIIRLGRRLGYYVPSEDPLTPIPWNLPDFDNKERISVCKR